MTITVTRVTPPSDDPLNNPDVILTGTGFVSIGLVRIDVHVAGAPETVAAVGSYTIDSDTQITIPSGAGGVVPSLLSLASAPIPGKILVTPVTGDPVSIDFAVVEPTLSQRGARHVGLGLGLRRPVPSA